MPLVASIATPSLPTIARTASQAVQLTAWALATVKHTSKQAKESQIPGRKDERVKKKHSPDLFYLIISFDNLRKGSMPDMTSWAVNVL